MGFVKNINILATAAAGATGIRPNSYAMHNNNNLHIAVGKAEEPKGSGGGRDGRF